MFLRTGVVILIWCLSTMYGCDVYGVLRTGIIFLSISTLDLVKKLCIDMLEI